MKHRIVPGLMVIIFMVLVAGSVSAKSKSSYYQVTVYHFKTSGQENIIDGYLSNALVPAMHRKGFSNIGVFKAMTNDTAADKLIYVLQPFKNLQQLTSITHELLHDQQYLQAGNTYMSGDNKNPPYSRMETIVLRSFELAPTMVIPKLTAPKSDHIYELRSYESATEKLYHNKVQMFNQGGEVPLFARLNFNAVFYGEVIAGSHMPNLMYMTSFENKADREEHWKNFSADTEWKNLSALPEYQNNVSHIDITFLKATDYSDF